MNTPTTYTQDDTICTSVNTLEAPLVGDMKQDERGEVYVYTGSDWRRAVTPEKQAVEQEQEPVARVIGGVFEPCNDDVLSGTWELYAAPVRTVDLTDVDLWKLWEKSDSNIAFARAVIAADREKNQKLSSGINVSYSRHKEGS